ncbi:hypothetical protein HDV00_007198, partial [Rhizophlyctis rosea]
MNRYFADILAKAPEDVEKVEIQPDGTWSLPKGAKEEVIPDDDEEDDEADVKKEKSAPDDADVICLSDDDEPIRMPREYFNSNPHTHLTSRLTPIMISAAKKAKTSAPARKASPEVISLLSDDEDAPSPIRRTPSTTTSATAAAPPARATPDFNSVKMERSNSRRESGSASASASGGASSASAGNNWGQPSSSSTRPAVPNPWGGASPSRAPLSPSTMWNMNPSSNLSSTDGYMSEVRNYYQNQQQQRTPPNNSSPGFYEYTPRNGNITNGMYATKAPWTPTYQNGVTNGGGAGGGGVGGGGGRGF